MEHNEIFKRAEIHVAGLFTNGDTSKLVYHTYEHTKKVVTYVTEISNHYNLIDNDQLIVCIAAWFHDTGYLEADPSVHEEKSVELMTAFMKSETSDEAIIAGIGDCIMATKWPPHPNNLLQQILVDADTYNLGLKEFFTTNEQVYKEQINHKGYINRNEWNLTAIKFLEKHRYFTNYCKEKLQDRKKKNIKKIKKELKEYHFEKPDEKENEKNEKERLNLTTKGVQTMLRLTSANHMRLSDMADGKANILISVNAIIISVILSVLLRKLQSETYLTIPTMIFLASSVCTIVVAILATRPKITEGRFSQQDIADRKTNLLFFGNFFKMPFEDYESSMKVMMDDADYLYSTLIKDIYQLGVVLARKYRLINWAYNIFMFGIILSVLAFGLAVLLYSGQDTIITNTQGSPL